MVEAERPDHVVRGYPSLLDDGDSVSLRVFTNPLTQERLLRSGVRRLLLLATASYRRTIVRSVEGNRRLAVAGHGFSFDDLIDDAIAATADRLVLDAGSLPRDAVSFDALLAEANRAFVPLAATALNEAIDVLHLATLVRVKLDRLTNPAFARSCLLYTSPSPRD